MEELCTNAGGYGRFFRALVLHYIGWWAGVIAVPALFFDHHRCESKQPWFAWLLYAAVVLAMLALAVLLELSVVQRLGLLKSSEIGSVWTDVRWQVPLVRTVLWKLDSYTDVVFIFIAKDCDSSLWWASLATFVFGVVFGQIVFNMCFACSDCDHELPTSFGFMLLDFKLVNFAVHGVLPFDPDASHLPVARPVTLRTTEHLVGMEKIVGDIAQVCIQALFLSTAKAAHGFVMFSVLCGTLHGGWSLATLLRECWQDEVAVQAHGLVQGTALQPLAPPQLPALRNSAAWSSGALPRGAAGAGASASGYSSVAAPTVLGRSSATASGGPATYASSSSRNAGGAAGLGGSRPAVRTGGVSSARRSGGEDDFDPGAPRGGLLEELDLL